MKVLRPRQAPAYESPDLDVLGAFEFRARHVGLLERLARLESAVLARRLREIRVEKPVFVIGMARGGTTIALELLSQHPGLASQRYLDLINPFTPYLWAWLAKTFGSRMNIDREPAERVMADKIMVHAHAPESADEIVWSHFFPQVKDETISSILSTEDSNPRFEAFHESMVKKLLLARGGGRYLTKLNAGPVRMEYIKRIYPDVRFIILVRNPFFHVAALVKAHMLLASLHERDERISLLPALTGRFDFGPRVRFYNAGNGEAVRDMRRSLEQGNPVRSYALEWSALYGYVADRLRKNADLAEASLVVRHEDLCLRSEETIDRILDHCDLDHSDFAAAREEYATRLDVPHNYDFEFEGGELAELQEITAEVAGRYGYGDPAETLASGALAADPRWRSEMLR